VAGPASVAEDGLTLTIESATRAGDELFVSYSVEWTGTEPADIPDYLYRPPGGYLRFVFVDGDGGMVGERYAEVDPPPRSAPSRRIRAIMLHIPLRARTVAVALPKKGFMTPGLEIPEPE
jgi:hypothetical protein